MICKLNNVKQGFIIIVDVCVLYNYWFKKDFMYSTSAKQNFTVEVKFFANIFT